MDKIDRVTENIFFRNRSLPFRTLEKRLIDSLELEKQVYTSNFSKRLKKQAKNQFIVFMVSCFESYLHDIFQLMVEKEIITINQLMTIPKLKNLKLGLPELDKISNLKIKTSEIITNELNFQNFNQIMELCSLIEFDKHFDLISKTFISGNAGFTKEESKKSMEDLFKICAKKKDLNLENKIVSAKFFKMIVRNLYRMTAPNKKAMLGTIKTAILFRHKIVHKVADIKLPYAQFHVGILIAIMEFCAVLQEIYNIKTKKVSTNSK